jgi:hypothetical protein
MWAWVGVVKVIVIIVVTELLRLCWGLRPHSPPTSPPSPTTPHVRRPPRGYGGERHATPTAQTAAAQIGVCCMLTPQSLLPRLAAPRSHAGTRGRCCGSPDMCCRDRPTLRSPCNSLPGVRVCVVHGYYVYVVCLYVSKWYD